MMKRMGMGIKEVEGVSQVTIRTGERQIIIDRPAVTQISVQGGTMYQVAGGIAREEALEKSTALASQIGDEDVQLVASQANVGTEEARKALEESGGDLAKAILILKGAE